MPHLATYVTLDAAILVNSGNKKKSEKSTYYVMHMHFVRNVLYRVFSLEGRASPHLSTATKLY